MPCYGRATIRAWSRLTFRCAWYQSMACQSVVLWEVAPAFVLSPACGAASAVSAVICFTSFGGWPNSLVMRNQMEVSSLAREVSWLILIPYPPRYKVAFAFSIFLCPHLHRNASRRSYLLRGEVRVYHVPRTYQDGLGSACSPMVFVCLRQVNRKHLHLTMYLLVEPVSIFGSIWLTTFISSSYVLAIPSDPSP